MINIKLEEMFKILIYYILRKKQPPTFYYKREYDKEHWEYIEITEVDLLDSRFKTIDDDFSEFEWEIEKSNIYIEDNKDLWKII